MTLKRKAALLLAAVIMVCSFSVFEISICSAAAEVDGNTAQLLYALGIADADCGDRLEETVTRAEFARIAVCMMGMQNLTSKSNPFLDVHPLSEAGKYAAIAYDLGLMNGYGDTFGVSDPIICEDALRVLVKTIGYGGYADNVAGYSKVIRDSKITSGISLSYGEPLKMGTLLKLVYNTLTADMMEESYSNVRMTYEIIDGKTLLDTVHHTEKVTGTVTATELTELYGNGMLRKGMIHIGTTEYAADSVDYNSYIGSYVDAYIYDSENENKVLCLAENKKNAVLEIPIEDFRAATDRSIKYETADREETQTVLNTANVIYNNRYLCKFYDLETDLLEEIVYGSIVLKDSDGDGTYDVVLISDIKTDVIVAYDEAKEVMIGKEKSYSIADETNVRVVINRNGERAKETALQEDCAVEIMESSDKRAITVNVVTKSVKGLVKSIDSDGISINENYYEFTGKYSEQDFALERAVEIFIGSNGKIIYAMEADLQDSWIYGVVAKCAVNGGLQDECKIKIFDQYGKMNVYTAREKCRLDGRTCSDATEIAAALPQGEPHVIRFKRNAENQVTQIDTVVKGANEDDYNLTKNVDKKLLVYKRLYTLGDGEYYIGDDTVIFSVPKDVADEELYAVSAKTSFTNDKQYTVTVYDSDEYQTPGVIVLENTSADSVANDASVFVVKSISKGLRDGEEVNFLTGGYSNSVQTQQTWFRDGGICVPDVSCGDVIQISRYATGELANYNVLLDSSKKFGSSSGSNLLTYSYGTVEKYDNTTGVCIVNVAPADETPRYRISVLKEAKGYLVTQRGGQGIVEIAAFTDIMVGKRIYIRERYLEPKEFVVFE